jgi:hypothetical protein
MASQTKPRAAGAIALGGALALATAAVLATMWWRRDHDDVAVPMAAAAVGVLLISPHAMFYDATLLLVAVAALAAAGRLPDWRVLAAGWVLGAFHLLKDTLGLTPVVAVVVGAFVVVLAALRSDRSPVTADRAVVGSDG